MTKELVSSAIKDMPKEFDLDELFEKLIFIEKVEAAHRQVEEGNTITHTEMKNRILAWRK